MPRAGHDNPSEVLIIHSTYQIMDGMSGHWVRSPISFCQAPVQISLEFSLSLLHYTSLLSLEESAIWLEAYLKLRYES